MTICLSWKQVDHIINILAEQVLSDGKPDVIVATQRGGLIPGVILSHRLDVRPFFSLNITRTVSDCINASKMQPRFGLNISFETIAAKDVLLIDDIVGTGETLKLAQKILNTYSPFRLRSLACIINRENWDKVNVNEPSSLILYIGKEERGWIVFPWENHVRIDKKRTNNEWEQ